MAYNKMEDQPEGMDSAESSAPSESQPSADTYDLPADFDGVEALKEGDTITLRVVRKYGDGGAEVEVVSESQPTGEKGMMEDLRETMAGPPESTE